MSMATDTELDMEQRWEYLQTFLRTDWGLLEEPHSTILSSGTFFNTTCKRIIWPNKSNAIGSLHKSSLPLKKNFSYHFYVCNWCNQEFTPWASLSLWYKLSTGRKYGQQWEEMLLLDRTRTGRNAPFQQHWKA